MGEGDASVGGALVVEWYLSCELVRAKTQCENGDYLGFFATLRRSILGILITIFGSY